MEKQKKTLPETQEDLVRLIALYFDTINDLVNTTILLVRELLNENRN